MVVRSCTREDLVLANFVNINETLRAMKADPATAHDPIKREFVFDGESLTANLSILEESGDALHTQKGHDELVLILEGKVDFRVGDETRQVEPGDLVLIPKNTLHGPILRDGGRFAALSVFAPFFDRNRKNIDWRRDTTTISRVIKKNVEDDGQ